jgi:type II secretory pathway component GspD/PulD (secretin)
MRYDTLDIMEYQFEKSVDVAMKEDIDSRKIVIQFDDISFSQAMGIISSEYKVPIVWSSQLDNQTTSGRFENIPLPAVLNVLARRANANVANVGGVYYLGDIRKEDRAFCVLRVPPVESGMLTTAIRSSVSIDGVVNIVGSCLWICDNLESLRKIISAIEILRERNERSYVAEMYFIRVNEDHFVRLSADLQLRHIDIFSSAFNMSELFSMFADLEGNTGWTRISQRPVLYLSEGRKVTFTDGRDITREQKMVTERGTVETSGYQTFSDGTRLTMGLSRVSDKSYSVDIDLSVSSFDKADKSSVPSVEKSSLKADGLLVQDSQVYYIGSLRRDYRGDKGGLFSYNFSKSHDMITIWLRVRELKGSVATSSSI